jgi:hypothetical protein
MWVSLHRMMTPGSALSGCGNALIDRDTTMRSARSVWQATTTCAATSVRRGDRLRARHRRGDNGMRISVTERQRATTMSAATRGSGFAAPGASDQQQSASAVRPEQPKRINVAVTPEVVEALQAVIDAEQVSLTEAVRRLISYGDFVYRAVKRDGAEVLLRTGDNVREVVLL